MVIRSTHQSLKAAFTRQTQAGVFERHKIKTVSKLLATNRTCLYSRQLFHQLFRVGKLVSDVWPIGKGVGNCQPIQTRALFTWFYLRDTSRNGVEHEATFIEAHNCPAVWDVSSVVYKDTKNKQNKMEELADKLGFVQTFYLLCVCSLLVFCFTVLRECHCTTSAMLHWCDLIWREFDEWRNGFANFWEFANTSLTT